MNVVAEMPESPAQRAKQTIFEGYVLNEINGCCYRIYNLQNKKTQRGVPNAATLLSRPKTGDMQSRTSGLN